MARKRLTPIAATPAAAGGAPSGAAAMRPAFGEPGAAPAPPIARVAGQSAAEAALAALSSEVSQARAEGRLIVPLQLDEIAEDHLVRDRLDIDEAEMAVLMASLADRGQQTAIEVIDLGEQAAGPRYGLISGWRRLTALRRLQAQTGEPRFATVKALVRQPETASEAYRAMVDENEIRVGLSYWERARIAVRATEIGLYETVQKALRDLFASASRAKRSKIGSFVTLYHHLGAVLRAPTAVPERLGLALVKALEEDPGFADQLTAMLQEADPQDAAAEMALLAEALEQRQAAAEPERPVADPAPDPDQAGRAGEGVPPEPLRQDQSAAERPSATVEGAAADLPMPEVPQGVSERSDMPVEADLEWPRSSVPDPAASTPDVPGADAATVQAGVRLRRLGPDRLVLEGPGATGEFEAALTAWLTTRG